MADPEILFKAMADHTRQRLLRVLSMQELSVTELVEVLDQPQSTISRHLKVLREADLLMDRRAGATVMYCSRPPTRLEMHESSTGKVAHSNSVVLRDQLLQWIGKEQLEAEICKRVQEVIRRRRSDSTSFFETVGSQWDRLRVDAFGDVFHLEALTALLPADWTVADIGTGTGYLLPMLSAHFSKVIAVEPAGAMLEVARNRPELKSTGKVEFREGSLADLPLRASEVDLAIASLVLHHIPRPVEALMELRRCVRKDGRLLVIEQKNHDNEAFHQRMGDHWRGFAPATLKRWVSRAGFSDVKSKAVSTARPISRYTSEVPGLFVLTARVTTKKAITKSRGRKRPSRTRPG